MRFSLDRGMWPEALLAALATLVVAWPLTTLLREGSWIGPAILLVLLVAVVGSLLRGLDLDPTFVVLGQVVFAVGGIIWGYLGETLRWNVVPVRATVEQARELLQDAGSTLQQYAAPAPTNEGVEFLLVSVLVLTAISVDSIAVTGRAPAIAGIPLAAAFLVSVSNTGKPMSWWFFAAAALVWMLMVAQQGNRLVSGWSSADRRETVGSHDVSYGPSGHRRLARLLAAGTVLGALMVASVVPHLPPTFFTDGLARNSQGRSVGGDGQVSFTETMDVTADLQSQSDDPVLRYRSATLRIPPLRVTATHEYADGEWVAPDYDPSGVQNPLLSPPGSGRSDLGDDVPFDIGELEVLDNGLRTPHLAVPSPVVDVRGDADMRWDVETRSVRLRDPLENYTVRYVELAPRGEVPESLGEQAADPEAFEQYLELDEAALDTYGPLADEIVGDVTNDLEAAALIQAHFRSALYTYDLQLLPGSGGDPITNFLQTRQGYCVQFATAMVMMARHEGIPARMAVGFLQGEREDNGTTYVVLANRAHSWPELWIDGLGWTRFEPTPGVRTGPPPAYTAPQGDAGEEVPTVTEEPTPTQVPTETPSTGADNSWWDSLLDGLRSAAPVLLRALAAVVVLGLLMAVVAIAGRRHREAGLRHAATPQERIEGQWELLKRSLEDYGINPPPDRSPREMDSHYREKARLDRPSGEALGRATATLERARYAAPEHTQDTDDATMHRDVVQVLDRVSAELPWNMRASARLFPRSGVHYIKSVLRRWLRLR